jgi:hypothetical protein
MNQLFPLALAARLRVPVGPNHLLPACHRGLSLGLRRRRPLRRPSGPIAWKRLNHRGHQEV